jgi:polyadenylation factor subunit 2
VLVDSLTVNFIMEFEPYQTTFSDVNKLQQPFPYQPSIFDGKRLRKRVQRKTVDYFGSVLRYIESRPWMKNPRKESCRLAAHFNYYLQLLPPAAYPSTPANAICTKYVHTSLNKNRHPINVCKYMPDGKRLITGLSSGEFTLWNALTFNFETILQAHDQAVRTMIWSHDSKWMLTADDSGCIKYWQSNMNNVKEFQAHECPLREAAFSPTDVKFVTGADDKKVKIFDFKTCQEERILEGHRSEIRCVDWHPKMGLVVSGGKDKLVKLWEPRSGQVVHTIKDHKNYVMKVKFNQNGNWFITACRDLLIHMYDVRMNKEVQVFSGHEKRITTIAWHPVLEKLFVSGAEKGDTPGEFGAIKYWLVGKETEAGGIQKAHEG